MNWGLQDELGTNSGKQIVLGGLHLPKPPSSWAVGGGGGGVSNFSFGSLMFFRLFIANKFQKFSVFFFTAASVHPDWKKLTSAVRETSISRHNANLIKGPP